MANATIILYPRGREVELEVTGDVTTGGSNSYGSDEPAWTEVDHVEYWNTRRNRPVSKRLAKYLDAHHYDVVTEAIAESSREW